MSASATLSWGHPANARRLEVFGTLATQVYVLIIQTLKRPLKYPSSVADQYVASNWHHQSNLLTSYPQNLMLDGLNW